MKYYLVVFVILLFCLTSGCEKSSKKEGDEDPSEITGKFDPREKATGLQRTGFHFENKQALSYNKKALKLMENGEYDLALKLFNKARKLEPKNHVILSNLGLVYMHKKDYDKSKKYQNEAILQSDSTSILAFINMSNVYIETNKYTDAIDLLNIVLNKTKDPQYLLAGNVNLILAQIGLKNCDAGKVQYEEMKKIPGANKYKHKMEDAILNCKLRSKNVKVESRTLTPDEARRMFGN